MTTNVFGNTSGNTAIKIDTTLSVQKSYLRTICIEANMEEYIVMKIQLGIKNSPDLINFREAGAKHHADKKFTDPNIIKNNAHVHVHDKNGRNNVRFVKGNSFPAKAQNFIPEQYVDDAIQEIS